MTARQDAQQRHERIITLVLEVDADTCTNTYGVAPCTAAAGTGNECYNTFATCQDKANFARGTVTKKFCSRGQVVPGETVRPYISGNVAVTPTEIQPSKGLAMRSQTQIKLLDEPCPDQLEDPYAATRATPAQGTFWTRFLARNTNLVGRFARVRQGYVVTPWSWDTFQTQLFVVDAVRGPDEQGNVTLVLSDILKLADRATVPAPTDGILQTALKAIEQSGTAQAGGASTITLATAASATDSTYNGMEVYIASGTGVGQRRVISSYVGSTRVATVGSAWGTQPDNTSVYQISALQINVGTDKGALYTDPVAAGEPQYVRIGDEVIQYTSISGDVLSWPDGSYRAQWNTTADDHDASDNVQLCRAWVSKRPWEVLRDLHTESGIASSYLDLTGWEFEDTTWMNGAEITAIIIDPEQASDLATELLQDLNAIAWWDPVAQLVKMLANQPLISGTPTALTDDNFIDGSVKVEPQDADRITQAALYYRLRTAVSKLDENKSYGKAVINIDLDAQSANEYGDMRPSTRRSRWLGLGTGNDIYASQAVTRRVARLRNAPYKVQFKLDPKDEVQLGSLVNITSRRLTGATGVAKALQCRVIKIKDAGSQFEVTALSTGYGGKRYAVIAPNGQPDYGSADDSQRAYGYICNTATQKMSNGDNPYYIA